MGWKYIDISNLCSICITVHTVKTRVKICAQFPGLRRQSMLIAIFAIPAEAIVEMDSHISPIIYVKDCESMKVDYSYGDIPMDVWTHTE